MSLMGREEIDKNYNDIQIVNNTCKNLINKENIIRIELNIDNDHAFDYYFSDVNDKISPLIHQTVTKMAKYRNKIIYDIKKENDTTFIASNIVFGSYLSYNIVESIIFIKILTNNTKAKKKPSIILNNLQFTSTNEPTFFAAKNKRQNKNYEDGYDENVKCVSNDKHYNNQNKQNKTIIKQR